MTVNVSFPGNKKMLRQNPLGQHRWMRSLQEDRRRFVRDGQPNNQSGKRLCTFDGYSVRDGRRIVFLPTIAEMMSALRKLDPRLAQSFPRTVNVKKEPFLRLGALRSCSSISSAFKCDHPITTQFREFQKQDVKCNGNKISPSRRVGSAFVLPC
jgi:hypothetical protein